MPSCPDADNFHRKIQWKFSLMIIESGKKKEKKKIEKEIDKVK